MRKTRFGIKYWLAVLSVILVAGCGQETITIPSVVSTVPANGATNVAVNTPISATFSMAMKAATITASTFTVTGPGGAIAGAVTYSGSTATFTPTAALAYATSYTGTITTGAMNAGGTPLMTNDVWTFTTITPPPVVTETVPVNAATGVPISQALSVTFNEAVQCSMLASLAATFVVTGPGGAAVAGTVSCTGSVATFTPTADLAVNTVYTATITTGAQSLAGTPLANNYVWTFRTLPATTPPTVISTVPANGATAVAINHALSATFSVAMNSATIDATTFTLTATGGAAVTGVVTYVAAGSVATFTPAAALASSTAYTATITTGAMDLEGTALASTYTWNFTTAAASSGAPPTVNSTIPLNRSDGHPSQSDRRRHFQPGNEPCHDQLVNLYADGTRHNCRLRTGRLCGGGKYADFHADSESGAQHSVYSHDHNRGPKPGGYCTGQQLCLDVYNRNNHRDDRSGDRFNGPGERSHRRASESGNERNLYRSDQSADHHHGNLPTDGTGRNCDRRNSILRCDQLHCDVHADGSADCQQHLYRNDYGWSH